MMNTPPSPERLKAKQVEQQMTLAEVFRLQAAAGNGTFTPGKT